MSFMKTAAILGITALLACTAFADGKGNEWIKKSDRFRAPEGSYSVPVEVIDIQKNDKKESRYKVASKDGALTLVEQTAPVRLAGRKLLMRDHDLWLFSPNVSRPTRISFEQKLTGQVSNGDLMKTNFAGDYDATVAGEEKLQNATAVKLHLVAKNKDVTYRSIDYWINKSDARPMKAVFYALSGKPLKTALYLDFKKQLGRSVLAKAEITDALQADHKSILNYGAMKTEHYSDSYFSKESLGQ